MVIMPYPYAVKKRMIKISIGVWDFKTSGS